MKTENVEDTISQADAISWINAWRADRSEISAALPVDLKNQPILKINAFTFNLDEIYHLCVRIYNENHEGEGDPIEFPPPPLDSKINGIRFYLGLKNEDVALKSENVSVAKSCLIAVPVKQFMPKVLDGGDDVLTMSEGEFSGSIYDFSYPCPSTCANPGHSIMDEQGA